MRGPTHLSRALGRSRAGSLVVALAGVFALMALAPAIASATHFTGSTKGCNPQNECVLTIQIEILVEEGETITVDILSGSTGATFDGTPSRSGGSCPATGVTLVDPTTVHLDPSADLNSCTIELSESLVAAASGEVCQAIDSDFNAAPEEACAQVVKSPQCDDNRDNDSDGQTDFPEDQGCENAQDDSESPDPPARECTIKGTSGNDIIRGTSGDDVICAAGGNDIVYGGGDNDEIYGGRGSDILRGEGGNDRLYGGGGDDVLRGGPGDDRLSGGDGNDQVIGEDGNDRLGGGAGSDVLSGQGGRDYLNTRDNRGGNDIANGGAGDDSCETDRGDQRTSC